MAVVRDTSKGSPDEKSMDIDGDDSDMVIDEACIVNDHCLHLELVSYLMEHHSHDRLYKAKALHSIVLLIMMATETMLTHWRRIIKEFLLVWLSPNYSAEPIFASCRLQRLETFQESSSEGIAIWTCQSWSLARNSFLETPNHCPLSVASSDNHETFSWYAPGPRSALTPCMELKITTFYRTQWSLVRMPPTVCGVSMMAVSTNHCYLAFHLLLFQFDVFVSFLLLDRLYGGVDQQ